MDRERNNGNGIGFCGALTITFIILKLCGVIEWDWIWVLSPIWIEIIVILLIAIIMWFLD